MTFALGTGQTQGVDLHLRVGTASSSVTVTAEAAALNPDENRLQATLSSETVRDLPQLNRNLYDVLAVTPGVVGTGTRGPGESPGGGADNFGTQTPQLSANGRSYTGNLVMVDGMNVTSPIQNGNTVLAPVPDAVQEASLQANSWDAENQLGSSILIQVTTKSGTNQFHGTGSLFFSNQDLPAHSDFGSKVIPPFQRKDLVGALGGPIIKEQVLLFCGCRKTVVETAASGRIRCSSKIPRLYSGPNRISPTQPGPRSSRYTRQITWYPMTQSTRHRRQGNLPRNMYRNPGYLQVDASVLKNNHIPWIGEQLRFDFLNVLNRANLGGIDNNTSDA